MVLYERGTGRFFAAHYKEEIGMDGLVSLGLRTCDTCWPTDTAFAEVGFDLSMNAPNQSSEPTPALGTSPAGQEPRLP